MGVASIDRQHQELISRINSLLDMMKQGKSGQEIAGLLEFLEDYVQGHFSAEEDLMMEHGYPGYAVHQAEHAEFVRDFYRLKDGVMASPGNALPMIELQRRLSHGAIQHIAVTDALFGEFLKAAGAPISPEVSAAENLCGISGGLQGGEKLRGPVVMGAGDSRGGRRFHRGA